MNYEENGKEIYYLEKDDFTKLTPEEMKIYKEISDEYGYGTTEYPEYEDDEWEEDEDLKILTRPIIRGVVEDVTSGVQTAMISAKFHYTLIRLFCELCDRIRKDSSLNRVVLSGGVFQNSILLSGTIRALEEKNFAVYTHRLVPTNDGGICLGQAVIAAASLNIS